MPVNIVIADDDRIALNMMCDAFITAKQSVRLAPDGHKAQELIRTARPNEAGAGAHLSCGNDFRAVQQALAG